MTRMPLTPEQRQFLIEAVMTGRDVGDAALEEIAANVAMQLPSMMKRAKLADSSENRRRLLEVMLTPVPQPKKPKRPQRARPSLLLMSLVRR